MHGKREKKSADELWDRIPGSGSLRDFLDEGGARLAEPDFQAVYRASSLRNAARNRGQRGPVTFSFALALSLSLALVVMGFLLVGGPSGIFPSGTGMAPPSIEQSIGQSIDRSWSAGSSSRPTLAMNTGAVLVDQVDAVYTYWDSFSANQTSEE